MNKKGQGSSATSGLSLIIKIIFVIGTVVLLSSITYQIVQRMIR